MQGWRRNMLRTLPVVMSAMTLWWLGDHWLRRHGIDENLAWFGTLLAVLAILWLLTRLGLINRRQGPPEPAHLRLQRQAWEEQRGRPRWLFIVGLGVALVAGGLHLVLALLGSGASARLRWRGRPDAGAARQRSAGIVLALVEPAAARSA